MGIQPAPDDHFAGRPDCGVKVSGHGREGGAGGSPTVCAGIVSPTGVQSAGLIFAAPDDHFTAGPHCRVKLSTRGRIGNAGSCPAIVAGIVSATSVRKAVGIEPAPDNHFTAAPHCCVRDSAGWPGASGRPTIGAGIVSPASVQNQRIAATPNDHFTAAPYCRVTVCSGLRRVSSASGCPTIRAGTISAAGVHIAALIAICCPTPDDHLTAGPHRRVLESPLGRVGGAGGSPTVCAGIVPPARVEPGGATMFSTPDDHFAAGPDRRVHASAIRRVRDGGGSPRVVGAASRGTRYCGKRVVGV